MGQARTYTEEFKAQVIKLAKEVGSKRAAEVGKRERLKFIAKKTEDGTIKGKISFYCKALKVSRQGFYDYLKNRENPWKHEHIEVSTQAKNSVPQ